ncbi:MAG: chromate transporter [Tissierellia bacterium]|nr:chromate transporter [Tissierellia bacterium]
MYLNLLIAFLKIGITSFGGGYAAIPIIEEVIVENYNWLNINEMTDLISLSQMTPGPIALNAASFVGMKLLFIPGAIIASIATVIPQSIMMFVIGKLKFGGKKDIKFFDHALYALRPGVLGLILVSVISMFKASIFDGENIYLKGICGFIVAFYLYKKNVSIIKIVGISALIGLLLHLIIS